MCIRAAAASGLFTFVLIAAPQQPAVNFRSVPLRISETGQTGFRAQLPGATGIYFTNLLPEARFRTNQILLNGSGVAAGDVDGDGRCDLYFGRINGSNALYRNLGNWRFDDITTSAGVACPNLDSTGVAFADLDGDGDLDLVVNSIGKGTHVFLNDSKGHFKELTAKAPLNPRHGGMSMALGDMDGDGFLDLYVANYRTLALMDMPNAKFWLVKSNGQQVVSTVNGRPVSDPEFANRFLVTPRGGIEEFGEADVFYRNLGGTNFALVSFTNGSFLDEDGRPLTAPPFDWGLAVMFRDINQDGLPDIYVCNDFDSPDRIWINQGDGKFRAIPRLALRKLSLFSMGVDFADINRDGFDDIFVLDMMSRDHVRRMNFLPDRTPHIPLVGELDNRPQYSRNTLSLNRGDGTYAEMASLAGLQAAEWAWCPVFLDVDLDGWEDVLITNGHERDARNMDALDQMKAIRATGKVITAEDTFEARKVFPRLPAGNLAFRNKRDLTFEDASRQWRFDFVGVSHGMALADLDNDGDLDVIINNLNDAPSVLRNESVAPRVAVRLKGLAPNTAGIGAKIKVSGGPVTQQQEMIAGGRYLASDQALRVFAAGGTTNSLTIEVAWRSGRRSVVTNAEANRLYEIDELAGAPPSPLNGERAGVRGGNASDFPQFGRVQTNHPSPSIPLPVGGRGKQQPWFEDVSALLNHTHMDEPFDDFAVQPLLPNKLSQLGPGVSWHDIDGDGWEDAIVASGKGGRLGVFRNNQRGGFSPVAEAPFNQTVLRDQTTVLGSPKALLAGSAAYEEPNTNDSCVAEYDLGRKFLVHRLPSMESSAGPMSLADIDGDGDLDLFVGGRVVPGKYPVPPSSMLFRNLGGRWQADVENSRRLAGIGMVSGAVFSDINGDGQPDLLLACEWGPIRVFKNSAGRFEEVTQQLGLDQFKGWWNGIATGDFDGDGRMDIVASNWGRNTRYEGYRAQPLKIYFGNLAGDGFVQMLEAHYESDLKKYVSERSLDSVARTLPFVRARFSTRQGYGRASVEEILSDAFRTTQSLEANCLESTVFLNRGTNFSAKVLPTLAQIAPAFGVCVADFDGDGHEDVFLAQNFFATQIETPRYDGGVGLWLRGDGRGGFDPVPPQEAGLRLFGEQRGAAVADYDGDGRVDLLVGQNGQQTKLFHNTRGRPGLRVRLVGPPQNPGAVGAVLHLGDRSGEGAAREVQAGSGYWSQNSAVQVMCSPTVATRLSIRWPGGGVTNLNVRADARELTVSQSIGNSR